MLMEKVQQRGAGFRSLTEAIDTTSAAGRMMMQMVGVFAKFERAMLRERTKAGSMQPVCKAASAVGDANSSRTRRMRSCGWLPSAKSPQLTWRGCSAFIRQPCRACCRLAPATSSPLCQYDLRHLPLRVQ